jgi:hypothetical protein
MSAKKTKPATTTVKTLSDADKLKLLEGYKKYEDPTNWDNIPVGSHVRILKRNGTFIRGGFVVAFYMADGKPYLLLENNKYNRTVPNYIKFKIKLDEVKRIFAKVDTNPSIPNVSIPTISNPVPEEPETKNIQAEEIELLEKKIELMDKIISQKDSELNSLRRRVGKLEITTSSILKYLKQQQR